MYAYMYEAAWELGAACASDSQTIRPDAVERRRDWTSNRNAIVPQYPQAGPGRSWCPDPSGPSARAHVYVCYTRHMFMGPHTPRNRPQACAAVSADDACEEA